MKCNIISVGHKLSKWESEGIDYYLKQTPNNFEVNFIDLKGKQHPKMSKDEILKLEEELIIKKLTNKYYKEDILKLEKLISKDLSQWLK